MTATWSGDLDHREVTQMFTTVISGIILMAVEYRNDFGNFG